jgi:hypothetical protein
LGDQNALFTATGIQFSSDRRREGATVFIDRAAVLYELPMGFSVIKICQPPMTMAEDANGTPHRHNESTGIILLLDFSGLSLHK